jgi:hypothetical protein
MGGGFPPRGPMIRCGGAPVKGPAAQKALAGARFPSLSSALHGPEARTPVSACHFCGGPLDPKMRVARSTVCPGCGRDLHACVQCRHHDPRAHNQCREPQAEWVTDRERANFCDYFSLDPVGKSGARPDRAGAARTKLDSLFKPKEPDTE